MHFSLRPDVLLFFLFVSDKLTHQYDTRANGQRRMDHLEQENWELKEEIARLTALMEYVIATQNQPTSTPATPQQRTDISEIVSTPMSVVPASQSAPAMPAGFPWRMPPNFMTEGYALIVALILASRSIMSMPPHIVHALPRVEEIIYHSESYDGPDVYKKMDKMKE